MCVTVGHLQRAIGELEKDTDHIGFLFNDRLVFARLPIADGLVVELTARLVEGVFPNYQGALSASSGKIAITFPTKALESAVRRVAFLTASASPAIVLSLDQDAAVLSNMNAQAGSARIPVPCRYDGAPARYGINSRYLGDILKAYQGDTLGIEVARGLIMREPGVTFLVMPIALPV